MNTRMCILEYFAIPRIHVAPSQLGYKTVVYYGHLTLRADRFHKDN